MKEDGRLKAMVVRWIQAELTRNVDAWISEMFQRLQSEELWKKQRGRIYQRLAITYSWISNVKCLFEIDKLIKNNQEIISVTVLSLLCSVCHYTMYLRDLETMTRGGKKRKAGSHNGSFVVRNGTLKFQTHGFGLNSTYCSWMDGSITSGCLLSKHSTQNPFPSGKDHRSE